MIELAQAEHSHRRIRYQLIQNDVLSFLADYSCDGAFACFVFINVSTQARFLRILQEVYRVLKPHAPFVILDAHPDHLGKMFLDYQTGEVDTPYKPGESYIARLHIPDAPDLLVQNYYWPKEMYHKLFSTAGFSQVEIMEPTLKNLSQQELLAFEDISRLSQDLADWDSPPYMILRAVKHM
jgi:ubiquinone/menaquinone biosynthesis C-methylase UbiE